MKMTKETYDLMISLGFKFLNYPPKINQCQPKFLKVRLTPTFGCGIDFMMPLEDAHNFISYCIDKCYHVGVVEGVDRGKKELQSKLNELLNG